MRIDGWSLLYYVLDFQWVEGYGWNIFPLMARGIYAVILVYSSVLFVFWEPWSSDSFSPRTTNLTIYFKNLFRMSLKYEYLIVQELDAGRTWVTAGKLPETPTGSTPAVHRSARHGSKLFLYAKWYLTKFLLHVNFQILVFQYLRPEILEVDETGILKVRDHKHWYCLFMFALNV